MNASNMMDVVHYIFEQDTVVSSEDELKSQSAVRVAIYRDFYKKKYAYEYKPKSSSGRAYVPDSDLEVMSEEEDLQPFRAREEMPQKSTMGEETITPFDPTAQNPFNGILDAPMGL